jgi:hypothetical protein
MMSLPVAKRDGIKLLGVEADGVQHIIEASPRSASYVLLSDMTATARELACRSVRSLETRAIMEVLRMLQYNSRAQVCTPSLTLTILVRWYYTLKIQKGKYWPARYC